MQVDDTSGTMNKMIDLESLFFMKTMTCDLRDSYRLRQRVVLELFDFLSVGK